jgi:hypothetical protein
LEAEPLAEVRLPLEPLEAVLVRPEITGNLVTLLAFLEHTDTDALELSTLDVADTHAGATNGPANGSHYGAERVEYDVASALINYEEYHPFGTSAYRAVDSRVSKKAPTAMCSSCTGPQTPT